VKKTKKRKKSRTGEPRGTQNRGENARPEKGPKEGNSRGEKPEKGRERKGG